MNDSLMQRRGANWARRWLKRNGRRQKHHPLDGHARIRLTPSMPLLSKIMLAAFLFVVLIEIIGSIVVCYALFNAGAK